VYGVFDFVWHYALPVGIFVYCYGRIFQVVRRHNRIRSDDIPMVATAGDQNAEQNRQNEQQVPVLALSYSELNVLQTIIAIIVGFIVCWSPLSVANIVQTLAVCFLFALRRNRAIIVHLR